MPVGLPLLNEDTRVRIPHGSEGPATDGAGKTCLIHLAAVSASPFRECRKDYMASRRCRFESGSRASGVVQLDRTLDMTSFDHLVANLFTPSRRMPAGLHHHDSTEAAGSNPALALPAWSSGSSPRPSVLPSPCRLFFQYFERRMPVKLHCYGQPGRRFESDPGHHRRSGSSVR